MIPPTSRFWSWPPSERQIYHNVLFFREVKRVNRPVFAKILERRTAFFLGADLVSVGRTFFQNTQNVRRCKPNPSHPPFKDNPYCCISLLVLKNVSMVTNILVFVTCPSERGTVMLEGRTCNIASAIVAHCLKSMVQIVSMSVYTYTIGHSYSRNPTQNWATAPYFNTLEKSQLIVQNTSTVYPHKPQIQFTPIKQIYNLPPQNTFKIYHYKTHLQLTSTKHIYNLPPQNTSTINPHKTHLQFTHTKNIYN